MIFFFFFVYMTEAEKGHEIQLFWFFMAHLSEAGQAVET